PAREERVLLPGARLGRVVVPRLPGPHPVAGRPRARGPAGERDARRVRRHRRHALPSAGRDDQRGDGGLPGRPLRPLHPLRQPGGVLVHLHGDHGDHGRRGREGHARRSHRGRGALHGAARGAPGRDLLAVADAAVRHPARGRALLHARGRGAGGARRGGATRGTTATPEGPGPPVGLGGGAALAGVSFEVAPGTVTSLIGPNGAGKTTAFNVITGFQRPTQGTVWHDGEPITGWRPHRIAERGLVRTFQKTSVFPGLPVRENVLTGLHLRGRVGVAAALLARGRVREEERRLGEEADRVLDFLRLGP